jgi:hypothetical protein
MSWMWSLSGSINAVAIARWLHRLGELGFDFCKKRLVEAHKVGLGQFDFTADCEEIRC